MSNNIMLAEKKAELLSKIESLSRSLKVCPWYDKDYYLARIKKLNKKVKRIELVVGLIG
jgi:hypothetical protein